MQTFQAPLIFHLLLPDGYVRSIISDIWTAGRERCSKDYKWRLLGLKVGLVGCSGPFARHLEGINNERGGWDWRRL
jgi:hypothetical protein